MKELFLHQENELQNQLEQIRTKFSHAGIKGANFESVFREFLNKYLPKRLSVGTGQVIDSESGISKQIDILISTEYHPGFSDLHAPNIFFIEGICGAGEIKTRLTTTELELAVKNCNSLKNLNPKPVESLYMRGNSPNKNTLPYFIFCMESDLSTDSIWKKLNENEPPGDLAKKIGPDIVFVQGKSILIDPRGFDKIYIEDQNGEVINSWTTLSAEQSGLYNFVILLLDAIPCVVHMQNFMRLYSNILRKKT